MAAADKLTPMLRQYLEIKDRYPDTILFFRMGDFYEMFFDDAKIAAEALDITLTSRNKMNDEPIPMAGVPHFAAEGYVTRLVEAGHKVAVCEQVEDPKVAKGIVRREVARVVTPGVILNGEGLEAKANNFLLGIARHKGRWGIAYLDASTGDCFTSEPATVGELRNELARIESREMVLPESMAADSELSPVLETMECLVNHLDDEVFELEAAIGLLLEHFEVQSLEGFGCGGYTAGLEAAGAVLHYLLQTQPSGGTQLDRLVPYELKDYLVLDESTKRNLELLRTLHDGKKAGSLLHLLDQTVTAMGGRLLRRWLSYPLIDVAAIEARLDRVEAFYQRAALRRAIRDRLREVSDLERLIAKVVAHSANPRDLYQLRLSLERIPELKEIIRTDAPASLQQFAQLDACAEVAGMVAEAIIDEPPTAMRDGGLIRRGFHQELDELVSISREGKGYIAQLEAAERDKTGIGSLKVRYNKVFGYFIEVTRANLEHVPEHYIRKQTLTSSERFITPELKEFETKVLGAEERRVELEYELFVRVREQVAEAQHRIKALARQLAALDVLAGLGEVATTNRYVRPRIDTGEQIRIREGRHPVVERVLKRERFVPNDTELDTTQNQLLIITGPNMAGKSTVMRQVALIVLMAQLGSFVPAQACQVGVVDRIFTRVGASDRLSRGQSTFMVEMTETANILNFATRRSLVLLDEIGRGTSTFDGLSIAWAVSEYLHDNIGCKTMFATHYHELIDLVRTKERVRNFTIAVAEWGEKIVFLHKLRAGGTSRSYGIQVARLAGLPREVIERSKEILGNLERGELDELGEPRLARQRGGGPGLMAGQLSLFAPKPSRVREAVLQLDVNAMTPLEALSQLAALQEMARED